MLCISLCNPIGCDQIFTLPPPLLLLSASVPHTLHVHLVGCTSFWTTTSWSTSGLAYLSLWLAGKLRCFDGLGHPWKVIVSVMPTGLAVWIGITRLQVSCISFASGLPLEMLGRVLEGHCQFHAHWPGWLDWHHKIAGKLNCLCLSSSSSLL